MESHLNISHYSKFLSHLSIFTGLTDSEMVDIARLLKSIQLKPEEFLCEEGDPGNCFYIIESGTLQVLRSTQQGDNQIIAKIKGPSVIGEMALLDGSKRSATVRALSEVKLYRIECSDFQLLRSNWNVAAFKVIRNLGHTLCGRLRETNERITQFFENPRDSLETLQQRQKNLWEQRIQERGELV